MVAEQAAEARDFLPDLDKARAEKDIEGLNLLARYYLGRHAREDRLALLERAWSATQAALAVAPRPAQRREQEEGT